VVDRFREKEHVISNLVERSILSISNLNAYRKRTSEQMGIPARIVVKVLRRILAKILTRILAKLLTRILAKILMRILAKILLSVFPKILTRILPKIFMRILARILTRVLKRILARILKKILTRILKRILTRILKGILTRILKRILADLNIAYSFQVIICRIYVYVQPTSTVHCSRQHAKQRKKKELDRLFQYCIALIP
jgi:hypothetical protein